MKMPKFLRSLNGMPLVLVLLAAFLLMLKLAAPYLVRFLLVAPPASMMYPPAPPMPEVVSASPEELLAKYEVFLRDECPDVFAALQLGLTDGEIDQLETQYGFKLTEDLRALYRWHNGTAHDVGLAAFPDHEFLPLDYSLETRKAMRKQLGEQTDLQRQAYAAYAGHRYSWIDVIVDLAGDGYFYDPQRTEAEGSFFFCFAEDLDYVFFPKFRNYLAAVVEGQDAGIFACGSQGVETTDFTQAYELWEQYGSRPLR